MAQPSTRFNFLMPRELRAQLPDSSAAEFVREAIALALAVEQMPEFHTAWMTTEKVRRIQEMASFWRQHHE